jgi:hypothetical protein
MNETAGMLQARLGLIDRVRRIEHVLARGEQARIAAQLMKGFSHELGNQVQIVKLAALELARRVESHADVGELIADMTASAETASGILMSMFAAARPEERLIVGPAVANAVRAAVDLARPAVAADIDLRIELGDGVQTYAPADELEALVLAAVLDAGTANRISVLLRERTIQSKRWVELLRLDDRHHLADGDYAHMFEPHSLLHVVAGVAKLAGGDASLAPGRGGLELAVELPVAAQSSSS